MSNQNRPKQVKLKSGANTLFKSRTSIISSFFFLPAFRHCSVLPLMLMKKMQWHTAYSDCDWVTTVAQSLTCSILQAAKYTSQTRPAHCLLSRCKPLVCCSKVCLLACFAWDSVAICSHCPSTKVAAVDDYDALVSHILQTMQVDSCHTAYSQSRLMPLSLNSRSAKTTSVKIKITVNK
jgi:hypothetical protein